MTFKLRLAETASEVEHRLVAILSADAAAVPDRLATAMRHGALGGGKRFRPFLLVETSRLFGAARKHAADMSTRNFFDHVNPDGETFDQRITQAGYGSYAQVGENIAGGSDIDNASTAVEGWLASDGHCANIMNAFYTEFGAGAYEGSGDLTFYWTQEFGRPN